MEEEKDWVVGELCPRGFGLLEEDPWIASMSVCSLAHSPFRVARTVRVSRFGPKPEQESFTGKGESGRSWAGGAGGCDQNPWTGAKPAKPKGAD